jgi:lambda repressor-like predicted transcriptional regulator
MKLSKEKIMTLAREQGISQRALAQEMGICPSTLSNALNGRRGVGRTVLAAFLRRFPDENAASLTVKTKGRDEIDEVNVQCQNDSRETIP